MEMMTCSEREISKKERKEKEKKNGKTRLVLVPLHQRLTDLHIKRVRNESNRTSKSVPQEKSAQNRFVRLNDERRTSQIPSSQPVQSPLFAVPLRSPPAPTASAPPAAVAVLLLLSHHPHHSFADLSCWRDNGKAEEDEGEVDRSRGE